MVYELPYDPLMRLAEERTAERARRDSHDVYRAVKADAADGGFTHTSGSCPQTPRRF